MHCSSAGNSKIGTGSAPLPSDGDSVRARLPSHAATLGCWSICDRSDDLDIFLQLLRPNPDKVWTYDGARNFVPQPFQAYIMSPFAGAACPRRTVALPARWAGWRAGQPPGHSAGPGGTAHLQSSRPFQFVENCCKFLIPISRSNFSNRPPRACPIFRASCPGAGPIFPGLDPIFSEAVPIFDPFRFRFFIGAS